MHDIPMSVWFKQHHTFYYYYACLVYDVRGIRSTVLKYSNIISGPHYKPQIFSCSTHLINDKQEYVQFEHFWTCLKCQLIWNLQKFVCWLDPTSFIFFFFFDLFTKIAVEQTEGSNIKIGKKKNEKSWMHKWELLIGCHLKIDCIWTLNGV